ncbi:hypothetical protein BKA56DRAFT_616230 [Ilyonectria sp. MPI-CAGE-AT-0026]|nr:hypothetical protein BKA56DRAFT_616230 [Ilyonectria sp. MPI-CAGE-AT-0026]
MASLASLASGSDLALACTWAALATACPCRQPSDIDAWAIVGPCPCPPHATRDPEGGTFSRPATMRGHPKEPPDKHPPPASPASDARTRRKQTLSGGLSVDTSQRSSQGQSASRPLDWTWLDPNLDRDSRSPLKRPGISDIERDGLGWAGAEKRTAQCPQTARRTGRRKTFNRSNREVEPPARARSGRGLQVLSAQPGRDAWVFALARSHGQEPAR